MARYICSICNYMYNEEKEKTKLFDLPDSWRCPVCGAIKQEFVKEQESETDVVSVAKPKAKATKVTQKEDTKFTNAELSILLANLAKGCEKQYMAKEAELFQELAKFYDKNSETMQENDYNALLKRLNSDIENGFSQSVLAAKVDNDRGALRALSWSEKVSKIVKTLILRYQKEGTKFLQDNNIYVCEICGFIYVGKECPQICPICKVPELKIHKVGGM
ncbi:MAG: rubredoxin [Clostridiales bacterium]|nr:rubredoxin [Clostridiales bacterium]